MIRAWLPAAGFVYVAGAIVAMAAGPDHARLLATAFSLALFAFLWFVASLRSKLVRYDPDGFFAGIVMLGAVLFIALQSVSLSAASSLVAAPAAAAAACVVIGSSLASLAARKVPPWFGKLGVAGGTAVLVIGLVEGAADWTLVGSTVWASQIGFLIWVLATSAFLFKR